MRSEQVVQEQRIPVVLLSKYTHLSIKKTPGTL